MNKPSVCPSCKGSGQATDQIKLDGMGRSICPRCKGDGTVTVLTEAEVLENFRKAFDGEWL